MQQNSLLPTGSSLEYLFRFIGFIGITVLPVGALISRLFQIHLKSRLETLFFVLLTGTLFSNTAYFIIRMNHWEPIAPVVFYSIAAVAGVFWIISLRKLKFGWPSISQEIGWFGFVSAVLVFYLFHRTWHAVSWTPGGGLLLTQNMYADPIWKLSIASELQHSVPPQMPVFAGRRLTYHYFMELFTVFVHDYTRIDLIALRFFIIPVYSFLIHLLAVFTFFKRIYKRYQPVLFGLCLMMPLIGLGFVEDAHIPFAISLFLLVIMLIADALEMNALCPWVLIMILIAHSMMYESIISFNFIPGLGLGALVYSIWFRRVKPLIAISLGGCMALLFQMFAVGRIGGGEGKSLFGLQFPLIVLAIKDFIPLKSTLKVLMHAAKDIPLRHWEPRYLWMIASLPFLGVAALIRIISIYFNIGVAVLPSIWLKIRKLKEQPAEVFFLIPVLTFGMVFPFVFSISFLWAASFRMLTYAVYLLTGLTGDAYRQFWSISWRRKMIFTVLLLILYIVPAAHWQSYYKTGSTLYGIIPPEEMQVFNYLRTQTPTDSVLMHPFLDHDVLDRATGGKVAWVFKDHYYFGSALGGRRVVLEGSRNGIIKESSKAGQVQVAQITADIQSVYELTDEEAVHTILKKYNVNYLWVPRAKPLRFASHVFLEKAIENNFHTLYRVKESSS